ncbi:MAG: hypothetical protein RL033_936, partial [Pseudomonadota bacterium]
MVQLYPADKHCALREEAWSESRVRAGVREILRQSIDGFEPTGLWPRHPLDGDDPLGTGYYFGAGGVFWGVSHLSREGWIDEPEGWFGAELSALTERNVAERAGFDLDASRSYLFGDIPLSMLTYLHQRKEHPQKEALCEQLFSRLEAA